MKILAGLESHKIHTISKSRLTNLLNTIGKYKTGKRAPITKGHAAYLFYSTWNFILSDICTQAIQNTSIFRKECVMTILEMGRKTLQMLKI